MGDFVIGAAGEVLRVDGDVLEVAADEEEVGGEELGEFVEVDGMGDIGALVVEGRESGDEEVEKLFVGGEVLDRTIEIVVKFCVEDAGGFAESGGAFGEEGDFSESSGGVEEVVKVSVGEGGKIERGILLEIGDEMIEEGDGAVERTCWGLDGPFLRGEFGRCGRGLWILLRRVGPERVVDNFEIEENSGQEGKRKTEEVVRVRDEPMLGRSGDGFSESSQVVVIEADVLGALGDKKTGVADVGEGGEVGGSAGHGIRRAGRRL